MNMLRFALLLLFSGLLVGVQGQQSPYKLKVTYALTGAALGGGLSLSGHLYQRTIDPLSQAQLLALDPENIPSFDRVATRVFRPQTSRISDIGLLAGSLAPFVLLAGRKARQDWKAHLFIWWQVATWTDGLTTWTKALSLRPRPFTFYYAENYPMVSSDLEELVKERDSRFSFFSGHSSFTTASCFLAARMFADYYPDSRAKKWVWATAILLPATVAFLRVRAGKHYPTDVITGYLIGAGVGLAIPALYKRR